MALRLEVFETPETTARPETVVLDTSALEEARLAAYDNGYRAGWDDAAAAQDQDQTRVRADLARNLQALSFTYHEARSHMLQALRPLVEDMVSRLLPVLARESLGGVILEEIMPVAENLVDVPVVLVINPSARPAVEALIAEATGLPLTIEEEESLGEGQAYLRFGAEELRVDLDRAVTDIAAAVRGFFELSQQEKRHG